MKTTDDLLNDYKYLTLEKMRRGISWLVSDSMLRSMNVSEERDVSFRAIHFALTWDVMANNIKKEITTTQIPKTWWDMFKQSYFPEWMRRLFPVKNETIDITTNFIHICPHLNFNNEARDIHIAFLSPSHLLEAQARKA